MQYDVISKRLVELGHLSILAKLLGVKATKASLIRELPQETLSTRRVDFALEVSTGAESFIVLLEWQTRWDRLKPRALAEYRIRFQRKFSGREIVPYMVLFEKDVEASDVYRDKYLTFSYHLIKLWELEAKSFLDSGLELLPFVPLMRGGLERVQEIEEKIYAASLPSLERADLLTGLTPGAENRFFSTGGQQTSVRKSMQTGPSGRFASGLPCGPRRLRRFSDISSMSPFRQL